MRRLLVLAALLAVPPAAAAEKPRLAVIVVVDQMRPEHLEGGSPGGGFRRLRREGASFSRARYRQFPTETAPGHASISTGRAPAVHGIVDNDVYDRAARARVPVYSDPAYGRGPSSLEGPTLADALKASDPRARVFSVSAKDRGAVPMGGRRPDLVLWMDFSKGLFTTSPYYRRPEWLDGFNRRLESSGLDEMIDVAHTPATPDLDEALERLVVELMEREGVGRGPSVDLLTVSFSATDALAHQYGMEAPQTLAHLRALDARLGRLLEAWEKASGGSLVAVLTSDHGGRPAPEDPSGRARGMRRMDLYALPAILEKALAARRPPPAGRRWIEDLSIPHLYVDRETVRLSGADWPVLLREFAAVMTGLDPVVRAVPALDVEFLDRSDPDAEALRRSVRLDRGGDILLLTREDVIIHDRPTGNTHGTLGDDDSRVPLVFWGRGIPRLRSDAPASPLDVAPTLGRLLGLDYPAADGGTLRAEVAPSGPR